MKGEDLSVEEAGSTVFAGSLRDLPLAPAGDHAGTEKRIVFGPGRFWDDYVARFFSVAPGISTPFHAHDWPHYVLITGGSAKGKIMLRLLSVLSVLVAFAIVYALFAMGVM